MLLFASTLVPAADLDRNSFNLVKVNKGDFMLSEKLPPNTTPPPKEVPKVEDRKVEPPKKSDGPKIETRPTPQGKVAETPQTNPVYKDGDGNYRRRAEDGGTDWYWNPNNGGFWYRSGPARQK